MSIRSFYSSSLAAVLLLGLSVARPGSAQTSSTVPDAQVESNVLQALAGDPKLTSQTITTATVYGTVTISGSVADEATRSLAEQTVARTSGVKKVVDELTLGSGAEGSSTAPIERSQGGNTPSAPSPEPGAGSNPMLQSDGTMAPPSTETNPDGSQAVMPPAPSEGNGYPAPQSTTSPQANPSQMPGGEGYPGAPEYPRQQGYPGQQPDGGNGAPSPGAPPSYGPGGPRPGYPSAAPYGQQPYTQPQGYGPYQNGGNGAPGYAPRPHPDQPGGQPVVLPAGTPVRIRTNQGMDSRHTAAGTSFSGIVLSDVYAGGYVAIPRGAAVQGVVSTATASGALKGRGELALQLTSVTLAGQTYPLASDTWAHTGGDKTLRTVDSAIGLGVVGALIGGVAGGGPGAAIGAGVGGAAGIGASAASQGGQVIVPAEAVLDFRLTQPLQLTTISQAELNRLGAGVPYPNGMRQRYPPPPPPPYAYGPGYYAYPRYYRPYPY